jgi:anti-sigma factor ChrR (cupin superfamily)
VARAKLPDYRDAEADYLTQAGSDTLTALTEALTGGAEPATAPQTQNAGYERLMRAVTDSPLRYAPFYARLAELWSMPERTLEAELTRAAHAHPWRRTLLPGVRTFELRGGAIGAGGRSRLIRFGAGIRFPKHRHRGEEHVLVLEGSYTDEAGHEVRAGDEQRMPAGSEHELRVGPSRDCVAAVRDHGIELTGGWLRWLSKLSR